MKLTRTSYYGMKWKLPEKESSSLAARATVGQGALQFVATLEATNNDVTVLAGVYTISFLAVMAFFAIGIEDVIVKVRISVSAFF